MDGKNKRRVNIESGLMNIIRIEDKELIMDSKKTTSRLVKKSNNVKKVITQDVNGKENGFLIDIFKIKHDDIF